MIDEVDRHELVVERHRYPSTDGVAVTLFTLRRADVTPGPLGPIFEIRRYSLTAGSLPGVMKRWEGAIGERIKLSPLVLAGGLEFGGANRFVHIWAYKSMDQRLQVREQARKAGIWPPPGGGDELLAQETKIVMPSAFSPLQ